MLEIASLSEQISEKLVKIREKLLNIYDEFMDDDRNLKREMTERASLSTMVGT